MNLNLPQIPTVTEQPESFISEQNIQPERNREDTGNPQDTHPPPQRTPLEQTPEKPPETAARNPPQEKPAPEKPAEQTTPQQPARQPPAQQPAPQPPVNPPVQQPPPVSTPEQKPPETRDRTVYFIQVGSGGDLQLVQATRKLTVSDSPLLDALNALLAGPSAEEKNRGLSNLIPPNSRIISARVSGNTVFLNFNEEFRYNTLGREGAAAQVRQIVWTATEFPNVNDVQIMIDGNIVDFLMEGVAIRNPIGR